MRQGAQSITEIIIVTDTNRTGALNPGEKGTLCRPDWSLPPSTCPKVVAWSCARLLTEGHLQDRVLDEGRPHNHVPAFVDDHHMPRAFVKPQEFGRASYGILVVDNVPAVRHHLRIHEMLLYGRYGRSNTRSPAKRLGASADKLPAKAVKVPHLVGTTRTNKWSFCSPPPARWGQSALLQVYRLVTTTPLVRMFWCAIVGCEMQVGIQYLRNALSTSMATTG